MIFTDSTFYTGPELTNEMVHRAERLLGVQLPAAYLDVLRRQNGGRLRRSCINVGFWTPCAPGVIEIRSLLGVGGDWGIDSVGGSSAMIREWDYPRIGVVVCSMESGGIDAVMLDYRESSGRSEPSVVHVDEVREVRQIAPSFAAFLELLVEPDQADFRDEP